VSAGARGIALSETFASNNVWTSALSQIRTLRADDFDFVDTGAITSDPRFGADSFAASR